MKLSVLTAMVAMLLIGFGAPAFAGLTQDADNDGVENSVDNCSAVANAAPDDCDFDSDGYGNACTSDADNDGDTDIADFLNGFYPVFNAGDSRYDGDCDLDTDIADFLNYFYPRFQESALQPLGNGPSGLSCAGVIPCP